METTIQKYLPTYARTACNLLEGLKAVRSFSRPLPLHCLAKSLKSTHVHWVVGKCRTFRNDNALSKLSHLSTSQCACADFGDFAKQRNGGGSREKDLLVALLPNFNLMLLHEYF
jgi:hypothetical protein